MHFGVKTSARPADIKSHFSAEILRVVLVVAAAILAMLLPYLPGRFDRSAATVSLLAQLASFASLLLLLPVGIAWLLNRDRSRLWRRIALVSIRAIACVLLIAAIAANQLALGLIVAAPFLLPIFKARILGLFNHAQPIDRASRLPAYFVFIPIALVIFRVTTLPMAAAWSRDRAIEHSAPLIREIERFRTRTGSYPLSLHSLNRDVPTGVVGIERFIYEPSGASYNLYFVRPSIELDAQEVVMFNPQDEHRFTSHELDLLQYYGTELELRRGDRRRTQLPQRHWLSILFD